MTSIDDQAAFHLALTAEPRLQAIDKVVRALATLAPTDQPMCADCVWTTVLRPLVRPWLGWGRGRTPEQAADESGQSSRVVDLKTFLDEPDTRPEPASETERWLRDSQAWDAVTSRWREVLERADPGLGHGIPPHQ
jgi:hypothetical protein